MKYNILKKIQLIKRIKKIMITFLNSLAAFFTKVDASVTTLLARAQAAETKALQLEADAVAATSQLEILTTQLQTLQAKLDSAVPPTTA